MQKHRTILPQSFLIWQKVGGIPPGEKQKAGEEAIEFARQSLEIHSRLNGAESAKSALAMVALANALDYFNNVDDDEVPHLLERANVIFSRTEGRSSINVITVENHLGGVFQERAIRAQDAKDLERCMANLELALPHFREAARISRAINLTDLADNALLNVAETEKEIRDIGIARARAAAAITRG